MFLSYVFVFIHSFLEIMSCIIGLVADVMCELCRLGSNAMEPFRLPDGTIEHGLWAMVFFLKTIIQFIVPFVGTGEVCNSLAISGALVNRMGHLSNQSVQKTNNKSIFGQFQGIYPCPWAWMKSVLTTLYQLLTGESGGVCLAIVATI